MGEGEGMSKHVFKFGDRVTVDGWSGDSRALFVRYDDHPRYATLVAADEPETLDVAIEDLTPGWPDPPDHVRVRAAVAVRADGDWAIDAQYYGSPDEYMEIDALERCAGGQIVYIEALVPLPKQETIEAEVVS